MPNIKLLNGTTVKTQTLTRDATRKAVKRGAKWLDDNYPNWRTNLNKDELDLGNGTRCVFGQSTGWDIGYYEIEYQDGLFDKIGVDNLFDAIRWFRRHGFYEPVQDDSLWTEGWKVLEDQWRRELA